MKTDKYVGKKLAPDWAPPGSLVLFANRHLWFVVRYNTEGDKSLVMGTAMFAREGDFAEEMSGETPSWTLFSKGKKANENSHLPNIIKHGR